MQHSSLLSLFLFALGTYAFSGFGATCNSWGVLDVGTPDPLVASCEMEDGGFTVNTELVLDRCFANANGVLVFRASGDWDGSCTISGGTSADQFTGTVLHASCKNDAGTFVATSIDLNDYVGNENGQLVC